MWGMGTVTKMIKDKKSGVNTNSSYADISRIAGDFLTRDKRFQSLFQDLLMRYRYHMVKVTKKTTVFRIMGYFLLLAVPLISALTVTIYKIGIDNKMTYYLSIVLTVLTIINSTIKPCDKFLSSAMHAISLSDWLTELRVYLSNHDYSKDKKKILEYIEKKDRELSAIGRAIATDTLPGSNSRETIDVPGDR